VKGAARLAFCGPSGIGVQACGPMLAVDAAAPSTTPKAATAPALDAVPGKDCRVIAGALRADRRGGEASGAPTTKRDVRGVGRA